MSLLEVTDLRVSFPTADGVVQAVRGVSFSVERGQTLGIVGESGSGKTVLTQTLLGLTPGGQVSGAAMFEGKNLVGLGPRAMQRIRGKEISVIFQDPLTSLHPLYKVGWQICEMIRSHDKSVTRQQATERAIELLGHVGIPRPRERVNDYPHQFSGGMRQRAMIAMALANNPALLIADEPTTALDVTVQAEILDLIRGLQQEFGSAVIMITHDLGVIAEMADDVVVMSAGTKMDDVQLSELMKLCKGTQKTWNEGKSFTLVMTDPAGEDMHTAIQKLFNMTPVDLKNALPKINESRTVVRIVDSDVDLLRTVGATPGAVGVVDVYAINSSVKVIRVDGKLPFDVGYALKGN